jgi:hypothetical protein
MSGDTFGVEKPFLRNLLEEVGTGRAQLPEFQRGWHGPIRTSRACGVDIARVSGRNADDAADRRRRPTSSSVRRGHTTPTCRPVGMPDPGRPAALRSPSNSVNSPLSGWQR